MRQVDKEARELQKQGWRVLDGRLLPPQDFFQRPLMMPYTQSDAMDLQRIFGAKK